MSTIQSMEIPKPKNWQDFELIARDVMALRWKSSELQMNGRPEQQQNILDLGPQLGNIYHHVDDLPNVHVRKEIETTIRNIVKVPTRKRALTEGLRSSECESTRVYVG